MEKFIKLLNQPKRRVLGLMSGTSLDGVDLALTEIEGTGPQVKMRLIAFESLEMPTTIRQAIQKGFTASASFLSDLHVDLGHFFADCIQQFQMLHPGQIELIGSHGQTLWHNHGKSTLQLGDADVIAQRTGIVTIADFRAADVAQGGSGAPLVPYLDRILFALPGKSIAMQNLGGMGNVTLLPSDLSKSILAFDTGPCNGILNELTEAITSGKQAYDEDGLLAKQGRVMDSVLQDWLDHPYFAKKPPKSTGREEFGKAWVEKQLDQYKQIIPKDLLRTAVRFIAESIAQSYKEHVPDLDLCYLSGGGMHHPLLVQDLTELLGTAEVLPLPDHPALTADSKEAVAFALFAHERLNGQATSLPQVTGAKKAVSLGKISIP